MRKFSLPRILLLVLFLSITSITSRAQIAAWDLTGEGTSSAVTTSPADIYNANLDASNLLTRGAGAAWSTGSNSFRTTGFQNNGIATTNTDYFQFTLSASPGYQLSLSTIDAKFAGTATFAASPGVSSQFAYSLDGTNFTLIGSPSITIGTPATLPQVSLTGIAALQNVAAGTTVTFRYYASGQTATGGWGFNSSAAGVYGLAIGGTVVSSVSNNANLSNLSLSSGTLTPVFASGTTNYTASVSNAVSSITVTPTTSNAGATVTVNSIAVTSGSPSGAIALAVGSNIITTVVTAEDAVTTQTYTTTVTRAAAGAPLLTTTSSLADFGTACINTTTAANSFTIDGTDLDGSNIDIAALPGFTYSETIGGTYTSTLSFSYTAPGFTGKVIYVKFTPTAVQSYNGNIVLSGGGVASFNVAATGSGVNTTATVTTGASSAVTATTATAAGTITVTGCSPVTAYGIEYSLNTGFVTGTQVAASNLSAGNFSANITGLTPNARYFYKAYVTTGAGTAYGAEQSFINAPLPVVMAAQPSLTFTETFADIANWSDFFITGTGSNHWDGLSSTTTSPAAGIPNPTIMTASTNSFQVPFGTPPAPSQSGGVHKGTDQTVPTQSIVLLSTGSTASLGGSTVSNNFSAVALDFYVDFTGVSAGTLSFDYATINNGAGDRPGSLRVYYSINGTTFTELTNLINFTNNTPLSGSKSNVPLPAALDNVATARLRFYYYNGESGGSTGARPKLSIDNVKITSLATTPCVSPTAPATALTFGTITDVSIAGSFTAASPASNGYMVVMSTNSSLSSNPIDGVIYNIGDNVGDGSVISNGASTSFTATALNPLTTYYFFVFPVNSVCTGGPLYYTASVLNGSATTIAGLPPCAAPTAQATNLTFGTTTINSIQGSFTAATATDEYLVLRSTSATLSNNPVNTTVYNAGDILGNATVVQRSAATTFTANGLLPNTVYYFFVFSINSQACINGPVYNTVSPLNNTQTTQPLPPCAAPSAQPTTLILTPSNTTVSGTFNGTPSADDYLVVRSTSATLSATPVDNTDYIAGDAFGGGVVVANSSNTSFVATGLTANTTYYFFVFAANKNCSGGTKYATGSPLTGNITTLNTSANNYYFGTLHSHSDYSDGNKDHPGYTPADDYTYAATAQCMDYLGIAEHNHYSGGDPGNLVANYHLGTSQANAYTSAHPNFLALYGMEWGTISGGGHVLIYGNQMDDLWGWESGSGAWGASNNYDTYVPKGVYTSGAGLFKTVNDNVLKNTFASLAHPNSGDFNNIANIAYDVVADNAISAVAVESGPAFSTNTTYSDPASSMSYLWYYQALLAKGYHLGPTIDHDNHNTTFGHTTTSRTAIIAPNLTKASIMAAMHNMNFYATQDCDTKVDFTINTKIMGSIVSDRFAPNLAVTLTDATTSTSNAIIRVMFGIPGSGVLPVKVDSVIGNTLTFTDNNLANNATGYYYLDIVNGSSRIVTSPIWYSRNDAAGGPLPVSLNNFLVQKVDNVARISWTTEQETNSSHFIVERSVDGRIWNSIATVAAAGISTTRKEYSIYDNAPLKGINYYRIKQVDKDAKFEYSVVKTALFNSRNIAEVAPNPAKDVINLYINKTGNQPAKIQLLNASGKLVYSTTSSQSHIPISTTNMGKGLYFVKVINIDDVTTIRVLVQ